MAKGMCVEMGRACVTKGGCAWPGAYVAGVHAWQGACIAKEGACMVRGCVWLRGKEGACMVKGVVYGIGGRHGKGGYTWPGGMNSWGACMVGVQAWPGGMHGRRDSHCRGRYWNAFLLVSEIYLVIQTSVNTVSVFLKCFQ